MSAKEKKEEKKFGKERRRHKRISRNFILTYFDKAHPDQRYEISQLKNISMGGMCFITTQTFDPKTVLGIELKTPYLTDTTYIEGLVLQSHEKVKGLLYETRLEFEILNPQAEFLITRLVDFFADEEES